MRERVANKILKYRDKLSYTEQQINLAEETLRGIEKRKEKEPSKTEQTPAESTE